VGRSQKQKGNRREREVVHLHRELGVEADRVPLSGSVAGYEGDVSIKAGDFSLMAEVKARKDDKGFKTIKEWLGPFDLLVILEDRQEPLVVMPWTTYQTLIKSWRDECLRPIPDDPFYGSSGTDDPLTDQ
jgi:hypothetical protein